jgi:hypothetical protein
MQHWSCCGDELRQQGPAAWAKHVQDQPPLSSEFYRGATTGNSGFALNIHFPDRGISLNHMLAYVFLPPGSGLSKNDHNKRLTIEATPLGWTLTKQGAKSPSIGTVGWAKWAALVRVHSSFPKGYGAVAIEAIQ